MFPEVVSALRETLSLGKGSGILEEEAPRIFPPGTVASCKSIRSD